MSDSEFLYSKKVYTFGLFIGHICEDVFINQFVFRLTIYYEYILDNVFHVN